MNWPRSRCARNSAEPPIWRSRRSRTERVASANERYVAEVAAAAALIALTSTYAIIDKRPASLKPVIRRVSTVAAHEARDLLRARCHRPPGRRGPRRRDRGLRA